MPTRQERRRQERLAKKQPKKEYAKEQHKGKKANQPRSVIKPGDTKPS
jgi:hypothetical protein